MNQMELLDRVLSNGRFKRYYFITDMQEVATHLCLFDKQFSSHLNESFSLCQKLKNLGSNITITSQDILQEFLPKNLKPAKLDLAQDFLFPLKTHNVSSEIVSREDFVEHKTHTIPLLTHKFSSYHNHHLTAGRNVQLAGLQFKGVGRTGMVEVFDWVNSNGRLPLEDCIKEYFFSQLINNKIKDGAVASVGILGCENYHVLVRQNCDLRWTQLHPEEALSKEILEKVLEGHGSSETYVDFLAGQLLNFALSGFSHEYLSHDNFCITGKLIDLDGVHWRPDNFGTMISFQTEREIEKFKSIDELKNFIKLGKCSHFYSMFHELTNTLQIIINYLNATGIGEKRNSLEVLEQVVKSLETSPEGIKYLSQQLDWVKSSQRNSQGLFEIDESAVCLFLEKAEVFLENYLWVHNGKTNILKANLTTENSQNSSASVIAKFLKKIELLCINRADSPEGLHALMQEFIKPL